jgi:hypothetical protein
MPDDPTPATRRRLKRREPIRGAVHISAPLRDAMQAIKQRKIATEEWERLAWVGGGKRREGEN